MTTVSVWAPAKINLTLHVTGQRDDGYHELDSLVAFAPVADKLIIQDGNTLSLTVDGPEARGVPADMDNLVLRAAAEMAEGRGASISLTKSLPSAAGIGGGSSDAAAAVRGLLAFWNSQADVDAMVAAATDPEAVREKWSWLVGLGADVLMCLHPHSQRTRGIGDRIELVELPALPAVLVNPRVGVSTPAVFDGLIERENPPMAEVLPAFADTAQLIDWLGAQRNDLEPPARAIAPVIDQVLAAVSATDGCALARMSGSGATCFGLYPNEEAAQAATRRLAADHSDWWVSGGNLGSWVNRSAPRVT